MKKECLPPNFIANGKRVLPDEEGESNQYSSSLERIAKFNSNEQYMFTYNFYSLSQLKKMAEASSVSYQVCGKSDRLSPQDKTYLRQLISRYKFK